MKVKRAGIATKLLVLVLLVAGVTGLLSVRAKLAAAEEQRDQLQAQVQAQEEANAALADAIAHSDDLEYITNIARSKLGLLEPDEIRFVDTSK
ncbi:MAG: septum formation initiator family protein [Candidatus Enterenecus sp.]